MVGESFDQLVEQELGFLLEEYGFLLTKTKKIAGGYEMLFTNKTTAVHIEYEFREAYLFVSIYRLINGKFVENPRSITSDTVLNGFSLDDILALRNPDARVKPAYQYGANAEFYNSTDGLRLYIRKFAKNLREYAADMLAGDFQLFDKLDPIVKQRSGNKKN